MKPNILFILTDDQRYGTINACGNDDIITPNLDELVNRGTYFENAYIPGGFMPAICMPSRAMINTGRNLCELDGNGEKIPNCHVTIGESLKKAGYHTYGTGKWHNGTDSFSRSFCGGDNIFFGGMWDHWNVPVNEYDPTGEFDNEINFVMDFWLTNQPQKVHCDKFNPGIHSSEMVTNTAIDFLDKYEEEKPFYLYTAYLAPHDPRTMPEEYLDLYDENKLKLTSNIKNQHFDYGILKCRDERLAAYPREDKVVRKELKEYYAMITHLDFEIGRVIDKLKEKGLYENTIIVMCGDNGLALGQHGLMGKQSSYEHSIKMPLIVSGKGIPHKKVESNVYMMDIYPTILELIGEEIPESVTAKSFANAINGTEFQGRKEMYHIYSDLIRAYRCDQYKLIEFSNYTRKTLLFDLQNDPLEENDLSCDPKYAEILEKLRKMLVDKRDENENMTNQKSIDFWRNF